MKHTLQPGETPDTWDANALYAKAQRYAENMKEASSDTWEHALWSSFVLEFLARAALSNVSPALLADTKDNWASLFHSLGFQPFEGKFVPKSIAVSEVLKRLTTILADFTKEIADFAALHTGRRNGELHSGEAAFEGVNAAGWHPKFYSACEALLDSMDMSLEDLFGEEEAEIARRLMEAAADESAKSVLGDVERHKAAWEVLEQGERDTLVEIAKTWATRYNGHRVVCPACGCTALVIGEAIAAPTQKLENDEIIETQDHLPSRFECVACKLKISGLSKLAVVNLSDRYRKTSVFDAATYYAPEDEHDQYEDDNNEWH